MLQNMTRFAIVLLLSWHVFVVNARPDISECEKHEYSRCFGVYADAYRSADKNQPLMNSYCNSYKGIGECLMSNLGCSGEFINELRFIVLQHMIIDNKLGVCTHPDLSRLEQVFHDKEEYFTKIAHWKDLEADDFAPCAAKTNRLCATELAKEFMSNKKLCRDVSHFMDCYETAPCDDKIYKDFVQYLKMSRDNFKVKYAKELREMSCQ